MTVKETLPLAPAARVPSVHWMTPLAFVPPPEADTKLVPIGRGSVSVAATGIGPTFVKVRVYVTLPPGSADDGPVRERPRPGELVETGVVTWPLVPVGRPVA